MKIEKQFLSAFLEDLNRKRVMLPTLPEVAAQVRKLVNDSKVTARQLARVLGTDPALSTRLLKVVNSTVFRGREKSKIFRCAIGRRVVAQSCHHPGDAAAFRQQALNTPGSA